MFTIFGAGQPLPTSTTYNYKGNCAALKNLININWEDTLCGLSVQEKTNYINNAIIAAEDKIVPTKVTPNALHMKLLWMKESTLSKVRRNTMPGYALSTPKTGRIISVMQQLTMKQCAP